MLTLPRTVFFRPVWPWVPAGAVALVLLVGCAEKRVSESERIDISKVVVDEASAKLMVGPVGPAEHAVPASYVLVDVRNTAFEDADVTVVAHFLDDTGRRIGSTVKESLRIPAGARRTFAPVAQNARVFKNAESVQVQATSALRVKHSEPVIVTGGRVDLDGEYAEVSGWVVNTRDRPVNVIVFAAFYDAEKNLMLRRFANFTGAERIAALGKRGTRFRGPKGSRAASMFIGQSHYGVARVWSARNEDKDP